MTKLDKYEVLTRLNEFFDKNPKLIDGWARDMVEYIIEEECTQYEE